MKRLFIITSFFVLCSLSLKAQISSNPYYFDNPGFSISSFVMEKGSITREYLQNDSAFLSPLNSFGFKVSYVKLLNFTDRFALSTGFTFGKFFHRFSKTHPAFLSDLNSNQSFYITEFPLMLMKRYKLKDKIILCVDVGIKLIIIENNSFASYGLTQITTDSVRLNWDIYMDISKDLRLFPSLNAGIGFNYFLPNRNYLNFRIGMTYQSPRNDLIGKIVEGEYEFYLNGNTVSLGEYELYLSYLEFQVTYFFCRNKKWAKLGMPKPGLNRRSSS